MGQRRLTNAQKEFAKAYAMTDDAEYAAAKAGYSNPHVSAWQLLKNDEVMALSREQARKFLHDRAGSVGLSIAIEVGTDTKQPAGARMTAAKLLIDASGIAITEAEGGKDPSEMDGAELRSHLARLQRQQDAIEGALANKARDVTPVTPDLGLFD